MTEIPRSGPLRRWRYLHVFPTFEAAGAQLRVANIIRRMRGDVEHHILSLDGNFQAADSIGGGLPVELVPPPSQGSQIRRVLALRRTIRSVSPDLLLTYNWGAIDAVAAALPGRICPVVHNECGFSEEPANIPWRRVAARRVLLNRIAKTIVVSEALRQIALERFRVEPGRVVFIRTGVDVNRFAPGSEPELRTKLGVGGAATVVFGYAGGLRKEKNVGMLLRAFAEAREPEARLVVFGDGKEKASLEALVKNLGIRDRVVFAGHMAEMAACYRAMDVFLMSSLTEQTPNALLEAMASGLPVLCTGVGDSAALLGPHQRPHVVPLHDEAGYVESLRHLARQPEDRKRLGCANRKRCEETFPMDRMVQEYVSVYESTRRSPPGAARFAGSGDQRRAAQ